MGHHRHTFLFLSIAVIGFGCLTASDSAQIGHNGSSTGGMCNSTEHTCSPLPNFTVNNFLHCVGLSMNMSDSKKHIQNLKGVIDEALDVYSFLISDIGQGPMLEFGAHIVGNLSEGEQFQDVSFIKAWFQLKLRPLLSTVSRQILSCLSTKNFSCETYQTMVKDLSLHFSSLDPARQKWIYTLFMHPFLSRNSTGDKGCVSSGDDSQMWLMKNFGAFSRLAHFQDFTTFNLVFSGLEVLNLLTPEQKAELLLHPEIGGLDNETISLVFESLLKPLQNNHHLNQSGAMVNSTMPPPTYNQSTVTSHHLKESFKNFLKFVKPLEKFIKHFVSLTHQANLTSMKSHKLTQAVLNWTLAELADHFPKNLTLSNDTKPNNNSLNNFDIFRMEDWFQHVVVPVLRRFLPHNQTEIPQNLIDVFYHVFSSNSDMHPDPSGSPDICSAIMDEQYCFTSNTVENLGNVMSCVARTNITEDGLKPLVIELSGTLHSLIVQYSKMNMSSMGSPLFNSSAQPQMDTFTSGNFQHMDFVHLWFQAKLRPVLPSVSAEFLSCLSTRNFSCQSYQALIMELSDNMSLLDEWRQQLVYTHFIQRFLRRRQYEGSSCNPYTNSSTDWVVRNFGGFSAFAHLSDFLYLNSNFSALEALAVLTPLQTAQLLLLPHSGPPEKDVIINAVFDHFLESPKDRKLGQFLHDLLMLAREDKISCESYKIIFTRLDQAASSGSNEFESMTSVIRADLTQVALQDCTTNEISPGCLHTPVKESRVCAGFNSSALASYLTDGNTTMMLCNGSLRQHACLPSLTHLTAENVVVLLSCKLSGNRTYSKETWKLFFTKVSGVLDKALLMFSNLSHSLSNPSATHILDVLGEILVDGPSNSTLANVDLISMLFQRKLIPFLQFASPAFLSCLSAQNFSCETYQAIVRIANHNYKTMDRRQRILTYTYFIQFYLSQTNTSDLGCVSSSNSSAQWLQLNFGEFASFLTFQEILRLNRNFSVIDALPHLTVEQLAEASATLDQLKTPRDVNRLMSYVPDTHLGVFFDLFSPAIEGHNFPVEVRSAMLQQVLDRGNLSDPSVNSTEIQVWLKRLRPLLPNMSKNQVTPYFSIVRHRDCNTHHEAVELLNAVRQTLSNDTESGVNGAILLSLREPTPLYCYANQSFYSFLQRSFLDFKFPELSTFLSLIPQNRTAEIINSMPPSDLGSFLRRPMAVDTNDTELCTVFNHYSRTPEFLEQEKVPDHVRRQILPCVWPLALRSDNETEVNKWFEVRLRDYLKFLNKDLISSTDTLNAMCLPFRRIVSILGNSYNYNNSGIRKDDVYHTIKTYLRTNGTTPKCYSTTDPQLNSTAWFVDYFGVFIMYITLDDLCTFGSEEALQIFSVNPQNIKLFSLSGVPQNVTSYYTELIFLQNPTFNATRLPSRFQCDVPGEAYSQLDEGQSLAVLHNLNQSCLNVDNQVYAALAGNIETINTVAITALGNEVTGLSSAQIAAASPQVITDSLQTLGSVSGWTQGQANAIIDVLFEGHFQFDSQQNLVQLGSLISGVPSTTISKIKPTVLQQTAADPTFIANILNAPQIVKQTYVHQIITLDTAPQKLLENIPDEMATEIPRSLLNFSASADSVVVQRINQKKWKSEQAVLFFDTVANGINNADDISADVLQGFTCSRVQTFQKTKIKKLIKACRQRKNRRKVILKETQLTCMYNNIKDEELQTFIDFPPDMLLYYNYVNVQQANCKSYFQATGNANFNVLSHALNQKKNILLDNAKSCLGITGTNISKENVEVLGNMCCTLNEPYINNSHPLILEKLKNCEDLSDTQVTAVENVLVRGNTKYGDPMKWNIKTLESLGVLPLYLQKKFWSHFKRRHIRTFLKKFLKKLRKGKTEKRKMERLFETLSSYSRVKRAADQCTVGNITQVTISDEAFPFGYDSTQFNHCLSVEVVKNNLAGLSKKVVVNTFQRIILGKLNQAYPSGLPEEQIQLLGSVSRVASLHDISRWNISTIDTLAALMVPSDGNWEADKSKAIITKYLINNTLGTSELNLIQGTNLCSLNSNVLGNISPSSLRDANSLDVSECSTKQKVTLIAIAFAAFKTQETNHTSLTTYQLIQNYLGAAPLDYIQQLSASNVSMDIQTFINLSESVVLALRVREVEGLLGVNLPDLKTFENVTVIRTWIQRQSQIDLQGLGVGITGGGSTTATTATGTATGTATAATTTSGHEQTSTPSAHQLTLSVGLTFIALQMLT